MFSCHLVGLGTTGYKCGKGEYCKEPICRSKLGFFSLVIYEGVALNLKAKVSSSLLDLENQTWVFI